MISKPISVKLCSSEERGGYQHWCPGCERLHYIRVKGDAPIWSFNGDIDKPTFAPSVRITYNGRDAGQVRYDDDGKPHRAPASCCHYFLTGGQLQFCGDSTHALAGRTVDLPDLPPELRDRT